MDSQYKQRSPDRVKIGFLGSRLGTQMQFEMWLGAMDACQDWGANLVFFPADIIQSAYQYDDKSNVLYDLVNDQVIDSLIIWVGGLIAEVGIAEAHHIFDRYRQFPMVTISGKLSEYPDISIDNYHGMRKVLEHLVVEHDCRRFAFLRGPHGHPETEQRFQACVDVLKSHNLPLNENLVATGSFHVPTGVALAEAAVSEWLSTLPAEFDAVVSATDYMALQAMKVIAAHGLRVPEDIVVVGFDDVKEARTCTPPLTTINQPFFELGKRAVDLVMAQMGGEDVPGQSTIASRMVIRESCGCPSRAILQVAIPLRTTNAHRGAGNQHTDLLDGVAEPVQAFRLPEGEIRQLLATFHKDIVDNSAPTFLPGLGGLLTRVLPARNDATAWQNALSILQHYCNENLRGEHLQKAIILVSQARVLVTEVAQRLSSHQQLLAEEYTNRLRETSETLISTFEIASLMDILAEQLPDLNFPGCYLSMYEDPEQPDAWANLLMAYNRQGRITLPEGGLRFRTSILVPEQCLSRGPQSSWVVEPLHFRERQLGIVVFEVGPREGTIYENLRALISSALQGALLMQQEVQLAIEQKRGDLLRKFVTDISHDLKTPLTTIKTQFYLLDRVLDNDPQGTRHLTELRRQVDRLETLFQDMLLMVQLDDATGLSTLKPLDVNSLVTVVLEETKGLAAARNHTCGFEPSDNLPSVVVDHYSIHIALRNIVINALSYTPSGGTIVIHTYVLDSHIVMEVTDNGPGISLEDQPHIFERFYRGSSAREAETGGAGLGLSIAQRIIALHGGTITVDSVPGEGSTFRLCLPVHRENQETFMVTAE